MTRHISMSANASHALVSQILIAAVDQLVAKAERCGGDMQKAAARRGKAALVADDDEFFRSAANSILSTKLGFTTVVEANSFDEAVDQLASYEGAEPISLALFDLTMPGISNPSNLYTVREGMPKVTVVVVSASEKRSDILTSLAAGVHGYVPKGLGIRELERALRLILAGQVYVPVKLTEVGAAPDNIEKDWAEPAERKRQLPDLTPRQHDVLELIVNGKSNKEIARVLSLSEGTVKMHIAALLRNLGVSNRTAAAAFGAALLRSAR